MNKKLISIVLSVVLIINCFVFTSIAEASVNLSADGALTLMNRMCDYLELQSKDDRINLFHLVHSYMSTDAGVDYMLSLVDDRTDVGGNVLVTGFIDSFGLSESEKNELRFFLRFAKSIPTNTRKEAYRILDDREQYAPAEPLTAEQDQAITDVYEAFIDAPLANMLTVDHGLNRLVIFNFLITIGKEITVTDSASDANDYAMYAIKPAFAQRLSDEFSHDASTINGTPWITGIEFMNIMLDTLNSSATFTDALNAATKTVLGRSDIGIYVPAAPVAPSSIGINEPANLGQTAPMPVDFVADVFPPLANPNLVEWYVNDEKQPVTGENFTFTPEAYGSYIIYATAIDDLGNTIKSDERTVILAPPVIVTPSPAPLGGGSGRPGYVETPTVKPTPSGELEPIPAPPVAEKSSYSDANNHWARDYIEVLGAYGILKGYEDGTVRPDIGVTREEMAVLLTRILGISSKASTGTKYYTDNSKIQSYAREAVYVLSDMNIYLGYGDGSFQPQNILTREEIISLFSRILGDIDVKEFSFTDSDDISYWAVEPIQRMCSCGIVQGYPDGSIKPLADVTRGEAAVMIYKLMFRLGKL